MEDLHQSQIRDCCRLAMPEGLRDLMCDISREVLRAQPPDLYNFIISYLEAMLLARDALRIACQVCGELTCCCCLPELEEELRKLDLDDEDLDRAKNVVLQHFDNGEVQEGNLIMKLMNKTNIDMNRLEDVQEAVQKAFLKHQRIRQAKLKAEAEETNQMGVKAAEHTLQFYENAKTEQEVAEEKAAVEIQTSFRGHTIYDIPLDEAALKEKKRLSYVTSREVIVKSSTMILATSEQSEFDPSISKPRGHSARLSSISLAGSLVNLPKYIPYSIHDIMTYDDFEEREKEHHNIDYTDIHCKKDERKKIVFHEQHVLHEIDQIDNFSVEEVEESYFAEESAENLAENALKGLSNTKNLRIVIEDQETVSEEMQECVKDTRDFANEMAYIENILQEIISSVYQLSNNDFGSDIEELIEEDSSRPSSCETEEVKDNVDCEQSLPNKSIDINEELLGKENSISDTTIKNSKAQDAIMSILKEKLIKLSSREKIDQDSDQSSDS